MPKIFISYRREDGQHQADRLHAALARRISKRNIFIDVDNIAVGIDFVQHLDQQVAQCDVLLALIGPNWLGAKNPQDGRRRLDDPKDFVRIEIASALKRGIPVAPVLLDGTTIPPENLLPEDLKALTRRNGVEVRRLTFDADAERLIRGLNLARSPPAAKPVRSNPDSARRPGGGGFWIGPVVGLCLLAAGGSTWAWFGNPVDWRGLGPSPGGAEAKAATADSTPASPLENASPGSAKQPAAPFAVEKLQTLAALDDEYSVRAGAAFSFKPDDNDRTSLQKPLTIIEIDGKAAREGQIVSLPGGHSLRVNVTSLHFTAGEATGQAIFYYTVKDKNGETARALLTVRVTPAEGDPAQKPTAPLPTAPTSSAGDVFRDCADCPQMVSIPTGSFMMGSPSDEAGRGSDEGPFRRVSIPSFAAGRYEVTWAEWDRCVAARGCAQVPSDGFGGGSRPVTNVSWNEAQAYTKWLSNRTGQPYRLLSEAEWEYAARTGTATPFSFGSTISTSQANYDGNYVYGIGSKGEFRQKTTPVGTFSANAFGLFEMHGNVWEWVQDCYAESYSAGQPSNGSFHAGGACSIRVLRGGAWSSVPQFLRSAYRDGNDPTIRGNHLGFRVARTLI